LIVKLQWQLTIFFQKKPNIRYQPSQTPYYFKHYLASKEYHKDVNDMISTSTNDKPDTSLVVKENTSKPREQLSTPVQGSFSAMSTNDSILCKCGAKLNMDCTNKSCANCWKIR